MRGPLALPIHRAMARAVARGVLALLASLLPFTPALALEEVVLELPLLNSRFLLKVRELESAQALRAGSSDLAELDRASGGAVGRRLLALFQEPVPLVVSQIADGSVGSPLLEQALLVVSSFGRLDDQPADLTGQTLSQALAQASRHGPPTLLNLIQAIPGRRVTINVAQARAVAKRMVLQRRQAERLLATVPAVAAPLRRLDPGLPVQLRRVPLPVVHRPQPLELLVLEPTTGATGRLVLISHGLWDRPEMFEGWGRLLASRGYAVVLPRHPGSDSSQQRAVLTGAAPPPRPEELALRPLDLRAVIDAAGRLGLGAAVDGNRVVVLGHSWGATTALQLAGVRPTDTKLRRRCGDTTDPDRNLSWTLQCSWLGAVRQASQHDPRVIAVVAVSPPASLLFPRGTGADSSGRVLLVSGSRDWVVPPDPEAVTPMRWGRRLGNQLVLVNGGDHFNLRPGAADDGGVLGALLLTWTERAFAAGEAVRPAADAPPLLTGDGWGSSLLPMAEVTGALPPI
ncbi:MAG: alpha/beta fold hydrolase [Cyanobacteriota bacterium]|nr:alpha/beta fold hydrolase [Cyanobacteriota bacterium]